MIHPTPAAAKRTNRWLTLMLGVAIVAALAFAILASRVPHHAVSLLEAPLASESKVVETQAPTLDRAPVRKFAALDILALDDDSPLPDGHPDINGAAPISAEGNDTVGLPAGHPVIGSGSSPPATQVRVEPARGNYAHTIAELTAQRQRLVGKLVRVRGEVIKVTAGVQGRAYFHLRDGNPGSATDLVGTALLPPTLGQVATFEGTLKTDVDVGIGYSYPVLLADAVLVAD
jgi:hypothetical protein